MPMPSANGNISIMDKEFGSSSKKSVDELKRQVSKLKAELESERTKLKQVHRDKTSELKRIQENYEKERHRTVESITKRLQSEHAVELRRMRESLGKEKDQELRLVLKFKEEELKALKQQIQDEKERSKRTEDDFKKQNTERTRSGSSNEVEQRLKHEIHDLKEQKRKLDESYKLKCAADYEKAELIRRLKSEHERQINSLIRESKREVAKEYHHLRSAEKALEEKNHELAFKDHLTRKLEAEKQEIRQRKTSLDSSLSDSPFRSRLESGTLELDLSPETDEALQSPSKGLHDKERELRKKNAELQNKVDQLEKKCSLLEKENSSKHTGSHKAANLVEDKVKKLKKRNSELVSIARQLEEKAKKLQEEKNATLKQAIGKANPSAEVEHMKKMFAKQRAKDLAEQARSHMEKDNKIENLRKEVASLAAGTRPQVQNDKTDELQAIIKKTAKERLVLEKKLASIESSGGASPVPETIDHEKRPFSNTLTENDGLQIKKQLEMKEREYENLKKSSEEMKAKCSKLELEREKFAAKCTMLHQKNAELGKRMKELKKLEEEIKSLKDDLQRAEDERHVLQQECMKLREQLKELMHVKQDLEASEQQRKMLEKEHVSSVSKLKEREEEIRQLHKIQEESTKVHRLAVTSLESDVRALQQKCADSNERTNNLKNELEKLKTSRASNHKSTQTETPSLPGNAAKLRDELRDVRDKETGTSLKEGSDSSSKDILEVAASRLKQLEMSDSEEDSLSVRSDTNKKSKSNQSDEDDISQLSRRIRQATYSDDSTSLLDDNYDSDASRDVSSMAEGDLADMEDNDITTSMVDGEETLETGNELDGRLDNNKNIQKGIALPNKIIPSNQDNNTSTDQSIDEKYLTQEQDPEDSDSEVDEDNLAVYIARYSYDPYQHSPNDCPDAELAFQAGDYLYVFGDLDEDGFFLGELMDGQRGLVPSNFVEKIADENEMPWINGAKHEQEDAMDGSDDEEEAERKLHRNLRLNVEHIPDSNLGNIEEEDDGEQSREVLLSSHDGFRSDDTDLEPIRIPSPKHVMLERQHTRSIVLNWKPADLPPDEVKGYGIYVDGDLKMLVKGGTNTKALIEDIDPTQTYRVSVRTITIHGDESLDQEAMLTIGKDASVAPSNLQVSDVSPTSAKIEWLPGNSSYGHEILINGTPHRNIRPGTYQYTLTNLEPKERYRVHVRARNPNILLDEDSKDIESDPLAQAIQFTTQEGGTPDPPLNVHLVATPSRSGPNTLEVSWIPVTITEHGTSNGARVTGYKVYINGVTCAEVTSPTAECVTVASWMIERAAKKTKAETLRLTVRTQSLCGESVPSNVLTLPLHTFNFQANKLIGTQPRGTPVKPKRLSSGEERKDDNHNVTTPLKTERNVNQKNELNNKDVKDEPAVINKPDPAVKPSKDVRAPPVPKKRTKGKPVVWKMEVEEEDDSSNKSDLGGNSSVDDDEQVEICTVEPTPQKQETRRVDTRNIVDNQNEDKLQQDATDKKEPTTNKNEPSKASEDICQDNDDVSKTEKRERKISELSDIDMDELNSSLNAAISYKREEKNKTKQDGKEPFLTPMDLSDSDIVDSSDEPLSVIDEAEEEAVDSMQKRSRSSHSHSLSDGFRSDDDVMDLLDEETDNDTDHALTAVNVRRLSAEQRSRNDEEANEGEKGLLRYLTNSAEQIPSNENEYFTNSAEQIPSNENEYLTNSAEQTPSNENEYSNGDRNQTYSDVEADHYEPDTPYTTSTPALSRDDANDDNQQFSQDYNNTSDDAANRTYTVEDGEETPEEAQEEELIRIFIALYDYNPAVQSPNPDAEDEELSFNEGDLIKIYGDKDPDGFYWGELDGRAGFVPHNMVSEVQVDEEDLFDRTTSSMTESQANQYPTDPEHPSATDPEHLQNEEPYPQDNVPDSRYEDRYSPDYEQIPVDGQHSQYPTVIVHKPSDASLHEPTGYDYQDDKTYQDDSNPVPHEATNETYSLNEDDSNMALEDPRTSVNYSLEPMKMVALFDYDPQMLSPNPDSDVELRFRSGDTLYVYGDMDEDGFYTGEISGVRGLVPSNFLEEFKDTSLPSQEPSDVSVVSEESAPGPSKTPNGTQSSKDEPPKKKKGIFSKGRQILKKMTKSPSSKK